jgi:hypothetical protein
LQYRCGAKAANDLDAFIARRPVSCSPISLDQYGRTVASCSVGQTDLAEWLVSNGVAIDWPQYSKGKFDAIQHQAEHAGLGMWSGSYVDRGYFGSASDREETRPTARTMRMHIRKGRSNSETPPYVSIGRGHFRSEATPLRTARVHNA